MKKYTIIFIALFGIITVSCKKNDQNNSYMNATVNGQIYESIKINAHFPASSNKGILSIQSSASGGRTISLIINGYKGAGTYNFKSDNITGKRALCTYSYMDEQDKSSIIFTTEDADNNGSITITKEEGNAVEGTFNFTALYSPNPSKKEYITISTGSFKANF